MSILNGYKYPKWVIVNHMTQCIKSFMLGQRISPLGGPLVILTVLAFVTDDIYKYVQH